MSYAGAGKRSPAEPGLPLGPAQRALFAFATNPDGGSVTLVGLPGLGKSRMLARLAENLSSSHHVQVQSAKPSEKQWPYSGVSAFAAGLGGTVGSEFDEALRASLSGNGDRAAVAFELLSLIRGRQQSSRIIVLDNFDGLDDRSQEILGFVLGRLPGTGLRVVTSVTGPHLPVSLEGTPTVTLDRLSPRELAELCTRSTDSGADPSAMHMIALASHGNPAFALSILDRLPLSQVKGLDPLILPFVADTRLNPVPLGAEIELPEEQRWLLQLLSTARTTPRRLLETFAAHAADSMEALEHAGIVGTAETGRHLVTIVDPRVRSTLYWAMSPDQRRLLHQQMAEHAESGFPVESLWHRSFLPDAAIFAGGLMTAACELAEAWRPMDAMEYAERALGLGAPQSTDFAPLGTRLSLWLMASGELAAALRYAELSAGHRLEPGPRIDLALATDTAAMLTRLRATVDSLEETVRTEGTAAPDNAVRALTLKALFHLEMWDSAGAEVALDQARKLLPLTHEVNRGLHHNMTQALNSFNRQGQVVAPTAEITEVTEGFVPAQLNLLVRARALSHAEQYAEAGHLLDVVLDNEAELPPLWRQVAHSFAMENEILAGNHSRAMNRFNALAPLLDSHQLQSPTQILLRLWHLHATGDATGAADFLQEHRSGNQFSGISSMSARASAHAGQFALMRGDIEAAVSHLGLALRSPSVAGMPHLLRATGDGIEALVLHGNHGAATRLLARYKAQVEERPTRWLRLSLATASAVAGDPNHADANFTLAVAQWTKTDGQLALGRIRLAHAQSLLRAGRTPEAAEKLKQAGIEFTAAGSAGWAARCAALLEGIVAPATPEAKPPAQQLLLTLTSDERIVVQRVLDGQRNKDIAAEIHVSLRTVEMRLTSVYRKFGARSRSHLAALLTSNS